MVLPPRKIRVFLLFWIYHQLFIFFVYYSSCFMCVTTWFFSFQKFQFCLGSQMFFVSIPVRFKYIGTDVHLHQTTVSTSYGYAVVKKGTDHCVFSKLDYIWRFAAYNCVTAPAKSFKWQSVCVGCLLFAPHRSGDPKNVHLYSSYSSALQAVRWGVRFSMGSLGFSFT
jgi:hypothetical protein